MISLPVIVKVVSGPIVWRKLVVALRLRFSQRSSVLSNLYLRSRICHILFPLADLDPSPATSSVELVKELTY